jgi:hypothetical protein
MIDIEQHHIDYYCGQHNMAFVAKLDGEHAGTLLYAVYEGNPSVTSIEVPESMRRRGIATLLVIALQDEYPDIAIEFGGLTDLGAALLNSFEWDVRENDIHWDAARSLAPLSAKLADYSARAAVLSLASKAERDAFAFETADWNDLHSECDQLREVVKTTQKYFRIVVGPRTKSNVKPSTPDPN